MAKRAKVPAKRGRATAKSSKVAPGELLTLLDFVRYAASRFIEAKLVFAHGTTDPVVEAAFLICEALHLHPDRFEMFATARVTAVENASGPSTMSMRVGSPTVESSSFSKRATSVCTTSPPSSGTGTSPNRRCAG